MTLEPITVTPDGYLSTGVSPVLQATTLATRSRPEGAFRPAFPGAFAELRSTPRHFAFPADIGVNQQPERLIRASLLQILFSVRSERQLMEQMQYNLLFRWFVGLGIDDPVWVPTVFTKNRDRLLTTEMSRKVMAAILAHREVAPLLSDDHFSVDGTLIKA